jgi:hypothetical protein
MRLTNYHRDAFVAAVLQDTPSTEIKALQELYEKQAVEEALKLAPAEVRKMWKTNALRPYLKTARHYAGISGMNVIIVPSHNEYQDEFPADSKAKLGEIKARIEKAKNLREELESKLMGVARACSTRKALATALPEFEKYLPEEQKIGSNLPALANVVSDFVKAGWPAQKQAQAA